MVGLGLDFYPKKPSPSDYRSCHHLLSIRGIITLASNNNKKITLVKCSKQAIYPWVYVTECANKYLEIAALWAIIHRYATEVACGLDFYLSSF